LKVAIAPIEFPAVVQDIVDSFAPLAVSILKPDTKDMEFDKLCKMLNPLESDIAEMAALAAQQATLISEFCAVAAVVPEVCDVAPIVSPADDETSEGEAFVISNSAMDKH